MFGEFGGASQLSAHASATLALTALLYAHVGDDRSALTSVASAVAHPHSAVSETKP
ncbi:hypothetical protein CATRI_09215 [Corynebacterium atrinae]|uniref:hypothetical protein n=1 Tax=Corynebacterium atrinae TaxID=1336740 RepID=UPI0025B432FA|nr:hypothetical protein [Corynebacterium atrinae]WJY63911.1 hypothetical protein CATRI_09215 [Corynebacterium atrinae]